jgi:hypothetical protein
MKSFRDTLVELLEAEASRNQIDYVLKFVGEDHNNISTLVDLTLFGKYPHSNRAGWTLDILDRKRPDLVNPYIEKILKNLENVKSDSIKRPVFAILSRRKFQKKHQAFLIDYGFDILQNPKEKVAAKIYAMDILANIVEEEPDLMQELFSVIEFQYNEGSSGFKAHAKMLRKRLRPQNK